MNPFTRYHETQLVRALAERLAANPSEDVHESLMTLVGHMQGDQLNADERALIDDLKQRSDATIRALHVNALQE